MRCLAVTLKGGQMGVKFNSFTVPAIMLLLPSFKLSKSKGKQLDTSDHVLRLPTELWVAIANCLSEPELWNLRSFNTAFLSCAMERHYGEIHVTRKPERSFVHFLNSLQRVL